MSVYLDQGDVVVHLGDCVEVMAKMEDGTVDAVVCDPPYGLGFMGKEWDRPGSAARGYKSEEALAANPYGRARAEYRGASYGDDGGSVGREFQAWCEAWAREALRVLKPGGHLLAFGGTRTFHRLTCAIEDAGFEIRDCLSWLYGSGFPKSLDVSKAIDKAAGAEREVTFVERTAWTSPGGGVALNVSKYGDTRPVDETGHQLKVHTAPATPEAAAWSGWGTALKPAWEPIVLARKPLGGTVAANVTEHGTGALNVDGCRIEHASAADLAGSEAKNQHTRYANPGSNRDSYSGSMPPRTDYDGAAGRWPANVVLDEEAAARLDGEVGHASFNPAGTFGRQRDDQRGDSPAAFAVRKSGDGVFGYGDTGGPSRFFYTAKASTAERGEGNTHPTVKPLALMRWCVRLITPPGGVVLDPFAGSGTTLRAARDEGFRAVGIEREEEYAAIIASRLEVLSLLGGTS